MKKSLLCALLCGTSSLLAQNYTLKDLELSAYWKVVDRDGYVNCRNGVNGSVMTKLPQGSEYLTQPTLTKDAQGNPWFRFMYDGAGCMVRAHAKHIVPVTSSPTYYHEQDLSSVYMWKIVDQDSYVNCRLSPRTGKVVERIPKIEFPQEAFDLTDRSASGDIWVRIQGTFLRGSQDCWIQFRSDRLREVPL